MADFIRFGQAAASVAQAAARNLDESDTAAFLALQQDMLQDAAAEARRSGATAAQQQAKPGAGAGGTKPGSAMELLMARMKK